MRVLKKITPVFVGSLVLFGFANAAIVTVGGHNVYEENFADSVVEKSGTLKMFDVGGTGVSTYDEAIGGSAGDGVSCATDGCSFEVNFSGGIENQGGNDLIIFGLGVGAGTPELFDIEYNGVRISDFGMTGTGFFENGFEISYLEIDLSIFGVALNDIVSKLEIIVNPGMNSEEFSLFASMNDVAVPLPAAVWLFGSVLAAGGFAGRRKRALKAAKA